LSPEDAAEYHRLFTAEYEATLDADHGSCLLRDPRLALQVEVALLHDDGVRYDLIAYAIMPNHVHVLVSLKPNASLERIIKAWKGVSARTINKLTEQSGPLWQANYWDRLIRNRKHFEHVRDYILNNPIRAHLSTGTFIVRELRTVSDTGELIIFRGKDTPVLDATREQGHSCPCSEPERGQECPHSHAGDRSVHTPMPGTRVSPPPSGDRSVPAPIRGQECPRSQLQTPCFVVDAAAIERNLNVLAEVKRRTGCRVLLALKAFSMFSVFPQMRRVLDGCCASSVHEARLGCETFGGEVHAFAAAFSEADMRELTGLVDHVTLNSFAQLRLFLQTLQSGIQNPQSPIGYRQSAIATGLRINPEHSEGHTALYDPCAPQSRLGIRCEAFSGEALDGVTGLHCHTLCEQNAEPFARTVAAIEKRFGDLLPRFKWMNFGGGHHITRDDYNIDLLCDTLNGFRTRHPNIEALYLEPGEACALNAGTLVATVLDVVENGLPIAILDASCACHMPDVMEMPYRPRVFRDTSWNGEAAPGPTADRGAEPGEKPYTVRLAGASCLAGDIIGDWSFETPLRPGDRVVFEDMAHYTMVKTNTFNGIRLPSIALREADGAVRLVRSFGYADFKSRLS
jgi:carboxynorspermidine decarboxylase